jgi:hypothetical protein
MTLTSGLATEGVINGAQAKSNPLGLVQATFSISERLTKWKKCKAIWDLPANAFDVKEAT